jgi:type II secretory pathway predicted ATPase ExeA
MTVRAFTSLKNLLLELGYTGVFVFIDEFESITRLSNKNKQTTLNSIRHLMDQNGSGLSVLFACAPEVWQDVMSQYHAFSERIGNEVSLRPLTDENLRELIYKYLETARKGSAGQIEPFDSEALAMIHQRSQGNIRQVLSLCGRALDHSLDNEQQMVTADSIQAVSEYTE